jgi:hypothetical protein
MVRCSILFTAGTLEGITYDGHMLPRSAAKVGHAVRKPVGGSPYKVVAVHGAAR